MSERMKREMMEHNMENMMAMKQLGKTGKVGALNPWHAQLLVAKKAEGIQTHRDMHPWDPGGGQPCDAPPTPSPRMNQP